MRCTVIWHDAALNELAEVWLAASDKQAVTEASERIEQIRRIDPELKGEEFYGDRLLVETPVAIVYRGFADDCHVVISQAWHASAPESGQ